MNSGKRSGILPASIVELPGPPGRKKIGGPGRGDRLLNRTRAGSIEGPPGRLRSSGTRIRPHSAGAVSPPLVSKV
jgi:hypothetical protein